jgi:hypothetical protein
VSLPNNILLERLPFVFQHFEAQLHVERSAQNRALVVLLDKPDSVDPALESDRKGTRLVVIDVAGGRASQAEHVLDGGRKGALVEVDYHRLVVGVHHPDDLDQLFLGGEDQFVALGQRGHSI